MVNARKWVLTFMLVLLSGVNVAKAQLDQVFSEVFNSFLSPDAFSLSASTSHGMHYIPASLRAEAELSLGLNSMISSNVSSFPLSSTAAGVTFDFSTGMPVSIRESMGPIFAETAETLGKKKLNLGFNFTHLPFQKLRGLSTQDIRFTFTHEDIAAEGLGDFAFELDVIDVFMDLDVNANIMALFATIGILDNLDLGIALPIVNVSLSGNARAVINNNINWVDAQFGGSAFHFFDGTSTDPVLDAEVPYDASATGIGDIAVRLKYAFLRGREVDLGALIDVRLPTGKQEDFLGTGDASARFTWILSKNVGNFTPHINISYDKRSADLDSDEFELTFGFDQKISEGVNFAFEFIGEYDIQSDEAIRLFEGSEPITLTHAPSQNSIQTTFDLSNIPSRDNDHRVSTAFGIRVAPSERVSLLGNLLVPLNDGGLRSDFVTTVGLNIIL